MQATENPFDATVFRIYARPVALESPGLVSETAIHSQNTVFRRPEGLNALEVEFDIRLTDMRGFVPGLPLAGTPLRFFVRLRRLDEYGFESEPVAESIVSMAFPYGSSMLTCRTFLSLPAGCLDGCCRFRVEVCSMESVRLESDYKAIDNFDFYLLDSGFSTQETFSFTEAGYINPSESARRLLGAFHSLPAALFEAEALEKDELARNCDDDDSDASLDGLSDEEFDFGLDSGDSDDDDEEWPECSDRARFVSLNVEFRGRSSWADDSVDPEFSVRFVYADGSSSEQRATSFTCPSRKDAPLTVATVDPCRVPALGPVYVELRFAGEPVAAFVAECLPHDADDREAAFSPDELLPIPDYNTRIGMDRLRSAALARSCGAPGASEMPAAIAALDEMVGLDDVKAKIHVYMNLMRVHTLRARKGISSRKPPLHALFLGAPGTGKTSVAKLMGRLMKEAGVLSKGHVVVRERSQIVGRHYGDESKAMLEAIKASEGGVLFIDEAYTLYKEFDPKDPGREAIETLLSALADPKRRDWMVILGGYEEPTLRMFEMNPGLASRFPLSNRYRFADYSAAELLLIAEGYCRDNAYVLAPAARARLLERLEDDVRAKTASFGNARHILNLLETEILPAMASRIALITDPEALTEDCLTTILPEDIPTRPAAPSRPPHIGFRA